MRMVQQWGNVHYPNYIRFTNEGQGDRREWTMNEIQSYLQSFNMANENVCGVAMYPVIDANKMARGKKRPPRALTLSRRQMPRPVALPVR